MNRHVLAATGGGMTFLRFKSTNHPQQVARRGAREDIDSRGTHHSVFDPLNRRFGFSIDVAASPHNAKCARFITKGQNGLAVSWSGERVWCNPPYSRIREWVAKAWREWVSDNPPELIAMLLPANRTEQAWWQDLVEPYRDRADTDLTTEFIRERIRFVRDGAGAILPNERPPFGCVLLVWSRHEEPDFREISPEIRTLFDFVGDKRDDGREIAE